MARLSQRSLDYSIKGYEFRNLDFARQVRLAGNELDEHHRRIKHLCRDAGNGGTANASDFRFTFAALSVAEALQSTYSAAADIAQSTIHLLESSGIEKCASLEKLGEGVNASMRMCVISLFDKDAHHARAALRSQEQSVQLYELGVSDPSPFGPQDEFERTVIRGLGAIAKQTREIADALLFWLEGNHTAPTDSRKDAMSLLCEVLPAQRADGVAVYFQSRRDLGSKTSQSFSC
jgi:hypothetical protein